MTRLLAALILALVLASSALAASTRDPKDPQLKTRAADVRLAKKLLVVKSDLPQRFADKGVDKSNSGSPACMPSLHALIETADVNGHDFVSDQGIKYADVSSDAGFFASSAEAKQAAAVYTSPKLKACLASTLKKELEHSGSSIKVLNVSSKTLTVKALSVNVRGWGIFITFKTHGLTLRMEGVIAFYQRGRAVSILSIVTMNGISESEVAKVSEHQTLRLLALPASAVR